jgi:FAD/FMN-containing dehydrogenase
MAELATISEERLEALATGFSGALLRPGDDGYEQARRVHNGLVDKRPALIARCHSSADVVGALELGRDGGFEISVRGGGHNVAGKAVTDGGVMIDLAELKRIDVDPRARTVRAGGGVTWGELNEATASHGLAVTGGIVSTTGIAGLTLGGGLGWLMGKYGLAADNLLSAELVTAGGDALTVTDSSQPDLFWALRGGGGNFGVATSFEYQLHPLERVYGGLVAHPFDAAGKVLRFYRDFTSDLPDEATVFGALTHAPDGSGMPIAALAVCHCGSQEQAESDLRPLLEFGAPVLSEVGPMPYPVMNTLLDDSYPEGALNYWKSSFFRTLDDGAIDVMVDRFAECPSPTSSIAIENFHGAVCRVGVSETAVPHREPGYNLIATSVWTDPAVTDENVAWLRDLYAALEPYFERRRYVNYLDEDDVGDAVRAAYGPNYDRLREVKRRFDPENLFRLNTNIEPV